MCLVIWLKFSMIVANKLASLYAGMASGSTPAFLRASRAAFRSASSSVISASDLAASCDWIILRKQLGEATQTKTHY